GFPKGNTGFFPETILSWKAKKAKRGRQISPTIQEVGNHVSLSNRGRAAPGRSRGGRHTAPGRGPVPPGPRAGGTGGENPQPGSHPAHGGLRRHRRRQARGADAAPV